MKNLLVNTIKSIPPAHSAAVKIKKGLNDFVCDSIEKRIAKKSGHEVLIIFGMRRSGNHLAINWLLDQTDGPVAFYNNIRQNAWPLSAHMREFRLRSGNLPRLVLSYEDITADQLVSDSSLISFIEERQKNLNINIKLGVILRDPYNLFASRLKKWPERFATDEMIRDQILMYLDNVKLAISPRQIFGPDTAIPILYNRLVSETVYRDQLREKFSLRSSFIDLDQVPNYGHGSSFDGYNTNGSLIQNKVLTRWEASLGDPKFVSITRNHELQRVAEELFGIPPPL